MGIEITYKNGKRAILIANKTIPLQLDGAIQLNIDPMKDSVLISLVFEILNSDLFISSCSLERIVIEHQDSIVGARYIKNAKIINQKLLVNQMVKELVKIHKNIDDKLLDIHNSLKELSNA